MLARSGGVLYPPCMNVTMERIKKRAVRRLRKAVLQGKVSVSSVVARVGRSERTVQRWIDGYNDPPYTVLEAIEDVLGKAGG